MFTFYNNQAVVSFFKVYDLLLNTLQMDSHKYYISFDFREEDEELEIGKLLITIKNEKNSTIYQNSIAMTYHKAQSIIKNIQLNFIQDHLITLPFFTKNHKQEIDAYHIRNSKFEIIQKIHFPYEVREVEKIQEIALKKQNNPENKNKEFSKEDEIKSFLLLLQAVLNELNTFDKQYFIYTDFLKNNRTKEMGSFVILIKDYYGNCVFYKDLYVNLDCARKLTNQIREEFIQNYNISLPSIHKDEINDTFYHHLKSNVFELIVHIQNNEDKKDTIIAQQKALEKVQENYEKKKIYIKKVTE